MPLADQRIPPLFLSRINQPHLHPRQYIRVRIHPTSPDVVLGWGGHIASRTDWGFFPPPDDDDPRSAGGISGSPYHMALTQWCNAGTGTR
jgi:hypothetical protein